MRYKKITQVGNMWYIRKVEIGAVANPWWRGFGIRTSGPHPFNIMRKYFCFNNKNKTRNT
jgi:hypothetical protein